jgi:hypothetical protein
MAQTTHRQPRGVHQPPKARVIEFVASDWLAADLEANRNKAAKAHQHDYSLALREQINWQSKAGAA